MLALLLAIALQAPDVVWNCAPTCQEHKSIHLEVTDLADAEHSRLLDLSRVESAQPEPVPVEQIADAVVLDGVALGLGLALDLWSTELATREGYVEQNPLGWNGNARLGLKIASTSLAVGTLYYFRRHGHHTLANVLRWICFGLQGVASIINFHNASHPY